MGYCKKCGAKIETGETVCSVCGVSNEESQQNKIMATLSYLGILVLIPLFAEKKDPFVRYHVNQGLVLFLTEIIFSIVYGVLDQMMLSISWRIYTFFGVTRIVGVIFPLLTIIGIINVVNGKEKELPVIGKIELIKE